MVETKVQSSWSFLSKPHIFCMCLSSISSMSLLSSSSTHLKNVHNANRLFKIRCVFIRFAFCFRLLPMSVVVLEFSFRVFAISSFPMYNKNTFSQQIRLKILIRSLSFDDDFLVRKHVQFDHIHTRIFNVNVSAIQASSLRPVLVNIHVHSRRYSFIRSPVYVFVCF